MLERQLAAGGAVAPVVGDHVAGDLVGPGVQALLFAQPADVGVQAQQDVLGEVVDGDAVGYPAGNERPETFVQLRPERLVDRRLRAA